MTTSLIGLNSKFWKWIIITRSVFLWKVAAVYFWKASTAQQKRWVSKSILCCLQKVAQFPVLKFFLVRSFLVLVLSYLAAMLNLKNYFYTNGFHLFCTHLHIYLYDVAYHNNEFFRSLVLNFFASYSITAMCGIVFLFFAISSWRWFAITTEHR